MESFKQTLNLPKTKFPMKADLPNREPLILNDWNQAKIYALIQNKSRSHPKYILHDGPPYANGDIHLGHVLNKTLKDIVVKFKTMRGFNSAYVPGWDCHGLPVEHQLFKELGISKYQIQQVEFRKKAHDYAMRYVNIQREQFKRLGVFGDWEKPYLTLDPKYEKTILSSFAQLVKRKYVYRDLKPVNWCFQCETALAEAEVEYENHNSPSIYLKFRLISWPKQLESLLPKDKKSFAIVWTTTPWTLIANVAVAVHPDFQYSLLEARGEIWLIQQDLVASVMQAAGVSDYKKITEVLGKDLEGITYEDIFLRPRRSNFKFVLADYVSKEEGTGLVHTAPGHGQEDYLTGKKYKLETIMPVDNKGKFYQDVALDFKGQHVFEANQKIIDKLKNQGNLLAHSEIQHSYPHCWRCKQPIIFRSTEQWFISIDKDGLRKKLLNAVEESVFWVPLSGKERISSMIESRPDWCISRQRYWGVPIPALGCSQCGKEFLDVEVIENFAELAAKEGTDCWFTRGAEDFLKKDTHKKDTRHCPNCDYRGTDFVKGRDILDVWFDSGVSHQEVLKNRKDLKYPCDLYLEGSDQHRGWFQSSLIPAMAIDGCPPFESVLTHGFVVDGKGVKMSKSQGNVISPEEIIKDYGVDILRMWVASSDYNLDVRISGQILKRLSEAYRKVRNTLRFILSNLYDFNPDEDKVDEGEFKKIDQWILSKSMSLVNKVTDCYEAFEFYKAYKLIYSFCNEDLSMYYLDMVKGRLYISKNDSLERRAAQTAIYEVINILLRLMAPVFVFTVEEIWQYLPKAKKEENIVSAHLLNWPKDSATFKQGDSLDQVIALIPKVTKALEEERSKNKIGSSFDAKIILLTNNKSRLSYLQSLENELTEIFKVSLVEIGFKDAQERKEIDPELDVEVVVEKAEGEKCSRCWNYSQTVGKDSKYPSACEKCATIMGGINEEKAQ